MLLFFVVLWYTTAIIFIKLSVLHLLGNKELTQITTATATRTSANCELRCFTDFLIWKVLYTKSHFFYSYPFALVWDLNKSFYCWKLKLSGRCSCCLCEMWTCFTFDTKCAMFPAVFIQCTCWSRAGHSALEITRDVFSSNQEKGFNYGLECMACLVLICLWSFTLQWRMDVERDEEAEPQGGWEWVKTQEEKMKKEREEVCICIPYC